MSGASPDVLERMRLFFQMYPQFSGSISATTSRNLLQPVYGEDVAISATASRKTSELPFVQIAFVMESEFYAHSREGRPREEWQRLDDHLHAVEDACQRRKWGVR